MEYYIADRMKTLRPSAIREILKYAADPEVISLAAGDPAPESLPLGQIEEIMQSVLKENPMRALLYSQSEGYPPLRERIKTLLEERYSIKTTTHNVLITSGAQQVMDLTAKVVCNEGDTVICENPSFIGSLNAFRSYGLNLVGIEMEDDGINVEKLEQALKENKNVKLIYVIPNFQNPTGITMSLEKRKKVYELAKKYSVLILEDNPYGDLRFTGEALPAIKTMDSEDIVIYAGTFSKILSSGMRLGYLVAPEALVGKLTVGKQCVDVHTSMLSQLICLEFLNKYDLNIHIENVAKIYKEKCTLMLDTIAENFPKEIEYTKPEGGLFVWCTMPKDIDTAGFAKRLVLENKVCIVPGSAFMTEENAVSNCFRMSFSSPSKENIEKGIKAAAVLLNEVV